MDPAKSVNLKINTTENIRLMLDQMRARFSWNITTATEVAIALACTATDEQLIEACRSLQSAEPADPQGVEA